MTVEAIVAEAETLYRDLEFSSVRAWKAAESGRRAIGYMPVWAPLEVIHAAGMLPVGIFGGGDQTEIIRGDACFQSYICHIPRSTLELALSKRLDCLDGMIFPSTCDVIRNLSGIWKMLLPDVWTHYLDVPQNFDPEVGGRFLRHDLRRMGEGLATMTGRPVTDEALASSIALYNENRSLVRALYDLRRTSPGRAPASEAYALLRAGCVIPVEDQNRRLAAYLEAVQGRRRRGLDNCRVLVRGAFCEPPPLALLLTLERAGCDIVDDDLVLVTRYVTEDVDESGDPWEALARAFLEHAVATASLYCGKKEKGAGLVEAVGRSGAEGVIFAAPSFCDPALLDQPMLAAACERAGIAHTAFRYAEDTGQFNAIREQAGTFADSIKLWSEA